MSTLLWSKMGPVEASDAEVRSTVTSVDHDAPASVLEHRPEWNETVTDPDTEGGLTGRQVASLVEETVQFIPDIAASAQDEHNAIINRQVSTSGTAAAREAAGQWGHGTFNNVVGIEPTIVDGHAMGSDYFKTHERLNAAGEFMTPSQTADPESEADAHQRAAKASRKAVQASMYAAFLQAETGPL